MDQGDSPEIIDDFELGQDEVIDIKDKYVNKQKLLRRISQYKVGQFLLGTYVFFFFFVSGKVHIIPTNI